MFIAAWLSFFLLTIYASESYLGWVRAFGRSNIRLPSVWAASQPFYQQLNMFEQWRTFLARSVLDIATRSARKYIPTGALLTVYSSTGMGIRLVCGSSFVVASSTVCNSGGNLDTVLALQVILPGMLEWIGLGTFRLVLSSCGILLTIFLGPKTSFGPSTFIMPSLNFLDNATASTFMEFDFTWSYSGGGPVCSRCLGDRDTLCACDRPNRSASFKSCYYSY